MKNLKTQLETTTNLLNFWNEIIPIKIQEETNAKELKNHQTEFISRNLNIFYTYNSKQMKKAQKQCKSDLMEILKIRQRIS